MHCFRIVLKVHGKRWVNFNVQYYFHNKRISEYWLLHATSSYKLYIMYITIKLRTQNNQLVLHVNAFQTS